MKKMRLALALLLTFTVGYLYINDFDFAKAARKRRRGIRKQRKIPLTKFLEGQLTYAENPPCQKDGSLIPPGKTTYSLMGSQPGTYQCTLHDLFLLINTNNPYKLSSAFFNKGNRKRLRKSQCLHNYTMVSLYSSPEMVDDLIARKKIPRNKRDRALTIWMCFDYEGVRYYLNDTNPPGKVRGKYRAVTTIMNKYK